MKGKIIEVKPKLKGGMENTDNIVEILCHNIHGFPSEKNNMEKLRDVDKLLEKTDMAIILETGNNKNQELMIAKTGLTISKENRMPVIKNA